MPMPHRLFILALTGALSLGAITHAAPAHAQVGSNLTDEQKQLSTTLLLGTTASTSIYLIQALTDRLLDHVFADAHRYMRENAHALQEDVSMGAGPTLDDLAVIYAIPSSERPGWGEHVRSNREQLVPLLCGEEMTLEQAQQFTLAALTTTQLERLAQ